MSKKKERLLTMLHVRLYPTPQQAKLFLAHSLEYIETVNVLVSALDADVIPSDCSTKDVTTPCLPPSKITSCVTPVRSLPTHLN